jgi:hypothetical protein
MKREILCLFVASLTTMSFSDIINSKLIPSNTSIEELSKELSDEQLRWLEEEPESHIVNECSVKSIANNLIEICNNDVTIIYEGMQIGTEMEFFSNNSLPAQVLGSGNLSRFRKVEYVLPAPKIKLDTVTDDIESSCSLKVLQSDKTIFLIDNNLFGDNNWIMNQVIPTNYTDCRRSSRDFLELLVKEYKLDTNTYFGGETVWMHLFEEYELELSSQKSHDGQIRVRDVISALLSSDKLRSKVNKFRIIGFDSPEGYPKWAISENI